jgi:predicted heme/steroid binding protein/uncharacterized membrane protein
MHFKLCGRRTIRYNSGMSIKISWFVLTCALLFCLSGRAFATEEYARKTGWDCSVCHVNPLGGGELTKAGDGYLAGLIKSGGFRPLDPLTRALRLLTGYLHILAGVVWFGTIFYVHIILKPAYASRGLPKKELILGWTCICVVGATGAVLTYLRMPSLDAFYTTRFGILLMVKVGLFLIMASTAALVTFVIGPRMMRRRAAKAVAEGDTFTPDDLSYFDGREGRKALAAVDGRVYDLTGSALWKAGRHMRHFAGSELTDALKQAPHGPEKLAAFKLVGRLVQSSEKPGADRPKAAFYFMAYMNLALVFLILGVVALWRWG